MAMEPKDNNLQKAINISNYRNWLKHDNGTAKIQVVSLSGEEDAIKQAMNLEGCPRRAITKVKLLGVRIIKY